MSKERYNQIIGEVYKNYEKQYSTFEIGIVKSIAGNNPMVDSLLKNNSSILSQQEFIHKCKTDQEFSERWGLKIEERDLSLEERRKIANYESEFISPMTVESCDRRNIPSKLITLTYQNEKIEVYE